MTDNNSYASSGSGTADESGAPASQQTLVSRGVDSGRGWNWITEAFDLFKKQPGMWILLVVIAGIIMAALAFVPVLGSIANVLLLPVFVGSFMLACRRQFEEGGDLEIGQVFAGFRENTSNLIMLGVFNLVGSALLLIAMLVIVGGGALVAFAKGGMNAPNFSSVSMLIAILLVVAASVPLYMALWFAPVLVALHGTPPKDALKASFFACLKNMGSFTVYGFALIVLCIVAAIPMGIGFLVLFPVMAASIYTSYRDIFAGD